MIHLHILHRRNVLYCVAAKVNRSALVDPSTIKKKVIAISLRLSFELSLRYCPYPTLRRQLSFQLTSAPHFPSSFHAPIVVVTSDFRLSKGGGL
jgi:hypothetical protein